MIPLDLEFDMGLVQVRRINEDVFNVIIRTHVQPHITVETAIGQVVDHIAKRRNRSILRAVQTDRYAVFLAVADDICNVCAESRVAAVVHGDRPAVAIDSGDVRRAVKLQEEALAAVAFRNLQLSAVTAKHRIISRVGIVQAELADVMRKTYRLSLSFKTRKGIGPVFGEFPVIVESDHDKLLGV